jgi:signal peptidase I
VTSFNHHQWEQPFKNVSFSQWEVDKDCPTLFRLEGPADQINTMEYNTSIGNDFRATYAYDEIRSYSGMPYCSDLMVRFYCISSAPEGSIGISLSKYETTYRAKVDFSGSFELTKQEEGKEPEELMRLSIRATPMNEHTLVKFANVDHQLIFEYGDIKLKHDLGRGLEDAGQIRKDIQPRLEILGSGKLMLSHVAVFRDIRYTTSKYANGAENGRAIDKPFKLGEDEFFVLGDNSPNSEDCRWWTRQGLANKGLPPYRVGIVPRDYLVGKALFVYWPSGFRPFPQFPIRIIPNIGQMRFIYGGSNDKL